MSSVCAFIVGIDVYDQPGFNTAGPGIKALQCASELIKSNLAEPSDVHVFLDTNDPRAQVEIKRLEELHVDIVKSADFHVIDTFWRKSLKKIAGQHDRLLFYWSGHGYASADGDHILLCRDYTAAELSNRVFNCTRVLRHLLSSEYQRFAKQICIVDACKVHASLHLDGNIDLPVSFSSQTIQSAYFAASEGGRTPADLENDGFTALVLAEFRKYPSWPDHIEFDEGVKRSFNELHRKVFTLLSSTPDGKTIFPLFANVNPPADERVVRYLSNIVIQLTEWIDGSLPAKLPARLISSRKDSDGTPPIDFRFPPLFTTAVGASSAPSLDDKTFDTLAEAFRECDGEVLLLGPPGSGKSTHLVMFARLMAEAALVDGRSPIPILANIHTWDGVTALREWALDQAKLYNRHVVSQWRFAFLLDGLDELPVIGSAPVGAVARSLPSRERFLAAFKRDLHGEVYIVSCRLDRYRGEPPYSFRSAIRLCPPNEADVIGYFEEQQIDLPSLDVLRSPRNAKLFSTPLDLFLLSKITKINGVFPDLSELQGQSDLIDYYFRSRYLQEQKADLVSFTMEEIAAQLRVLSVYLFHPNRSTDSRRSVLMDDLRLHCSRRLLNVVTYCASHDMLLIQCRDDRVEFRHLILRDHFLIRGLAEALSAQYRLNDPYMWIEFWASMGRGGDVAFLNEGFASSREWMAQLAARKAESSFEAAAMAGSHELDSSLRRVALIFAPLRISAFALTIFGIATSWWSFGALCGIAAVFVLPTAAQLVGIGPGTRSRIYSGYIRVLYAIGEPSSIDNCRVLFSRNSNVDDAEVARIMCRICSDNSFVDILNAVRRYSAFRKNARFVADHVARNATPRIVHEIMAAKYFMACANEATMLIGAVCFAVIQEMSEAGSTSCLVALSELECQSNKWNDAHIFWALQLIDTVVDTQAKCKVSEVASVHQCVRRDRRPAPKWPSPVAVDQGWVPRAISDWYVLFALAAVHKEMIEVGGDEETDEVQDSEAGLIDQIVDARGERSDEAVAAAYEVGRAALDLRKAVVDLRKWGPLSLLRNVVVYLSNRMLRSRKCE